MGKAHRYGEESLFMTRRILQGAFHDGRGGEVPRGFKVEMEKRGFSLSAEIPEGNPKKPHLNGGSGDNIRSFDGFFPDEGEGLLFQVQEGFI